MISIHDALLHIHAHAHEKYPAFLRLDQSLGLTLATDAVSDIDSPPFDKALMDGYALRSADVTRAGSELEVNESISAGQVPSLPVAPGTATRIMTGSPLPSGADTVVMLESTSNRVEDGRAIVTINEYPVAAKRNVLPRASCLRRGEVVSKYGTQLTPGKIGLLAEIGNDPVLVIPPVTVSIIATGDELVEAIETPGAGQIRNTNGPMLEVLAREDGCHVAWQGIVRDDRDQLAERIRQAFQGDLVILSGGVSAGDLDLVPAMLDACGVRQIFHQVRVKPGKPIWFGVGEQTLVFGLPGNPVSSFVGYHLFVRPAVRAMLGYPPSISANDFGRLVGSYVARGDRPVYYPARLKRTPKGAPFVTRLPWKGSADLRTLAAADCLAVLPADTNIADGGMVRFLSLSADKDWM